MTDRTLTTIQYRGASLAAITGPTPDTTLVMVKPLFDGMKLAWEPQRKRIMRHPVLRTCTSIMEVQAPGDDQVRSHVLVALTRVHFLMGTVQPERIKEPEVRAAVIAFQIEAADVLFAHFFGRPAEAHREGQIVPKEDLTSLPIQTKINLVSLACRVWGAIPGQELYDEVSLPKTASMQSARRQGNMDFGDERPERAIVQFRPRMMQPEGEAG